MSNVPLSRRMFLATSAAAGSLRTVFSDIASATGGPYVQRTENGIVIGNENIELKFGLENLGVKQFLDKRTDTQFLDEENAGYPPIRVRLYDDFRFRNDLSDTQILDLWETENDAGIEIRWSNPSIEEVQFDEAGNYTGTEVISEFSGNITVEAWIPAGSSKTKWRARIENNDDIAIQNITCPRISGITSLSDDGQDAIYIPSREGRKLSDPSNKDNLPVNRYPTRWGAMQMNLYLRHDFGLIGMSEDGAGYMKRPEFTADGPEGIIEYRAQHPVPGENEEGSDAEIPYTNVFGVHRGTWMDACDEYRDWVETEGWLQETDPIVPERLRNRGITFHHRSYSRPGSDNNKEQQASFDEIVKMNSNLDQRFSGQMGFRWWGWQTYGTPAGGDFWPPYEGEEKFTEVIQQLEQMNIRTHCFMNPGVILDDSDYWRGKEAPQTIARKNSDGTPMKLSAEGLDAVTVERVHPEWQTVWLSVVEKLLSSGIGHIELDGTPDSFYSCWNGDHTHPVGAGGNWYQQRVRNVLEQIHSLADLPDGLILGGEGIADFYLPYLNMNVLGDTAIETGGSDVTDGDAEVVPMFEYTFRDYSVTRDRRGHISAQPVSIARVWAGRAIAYGSIPFFMGSIEPVTDEYHSRLLNYYERIAAARSTYANRFLATGTMLPSPNIPSEDHVFEKRGLKMRTDSILSSAWGSSQGEVGVALTNVSPESNEASTSFDLDRGKYDFGTGPRLIYRVTNGEYEIQEVEQSGPVTIETSLGVEDVQLIVITEPSDQRVRALEAIVKAQRSSSDDSRLAEAKRAFEANEVKQAIGLAETVNQNGTTPTSTQTSEISSPTLTPANETKGTTGEDAPGFGIGAALVSVASTVYAVKRRVSGDSEE